MPTNEYHPLWQDFKDHAEESRPLARDTELSRSFDSVRQDVSFVVDGPTFAEGLKELNSVLDQLLAEMDKTRCRTCRCMFQPGVGVFTENAYFVPTGDLCAECIALRSHALELGLISSREVEADDDRYKN